MNMSSWFRLRVALTAWLVFVFMGCEAAPDLESPQTYTSSHCEFSYPGNWTVTEDTPQDIDGIALRTVVIETPGDAIFTVSTFSPPSGIEAATFAAEVEKERANEIKAMLGDLASAVEVSKSKESKLAPTGTSVGGLRHDFSIKLLGEQTPHWGDFYQFDGKEAVAISYAQVAHEDYDKVKAGFDYIYNNMKVK